MGGAKFKGISTGHSPMNGRLKAGSQTCLEIPRLDLKKMYGHKCLVLIAGESCAPGTGTEFNPSLLFSSSEVAVPRFVYEAASL